MVLAELWYRVEDLSPQTHIALEAVCALVTFACLLELGFTCLSLKRKRSFWGGGGELSPSQSFDERWDAKVSGTKGLEFRRLFLCLLALFNFSRLAFLVSQTYLDKVKPIHSISSEGCVGVLLGMGCRDSLHPSFTLILLRAFCSSFLLVFDGAENHISQQGVSGAELHCLLLCDLHRVLFDLCEQT